jgi:hypothetical protein
MTPERAGGAGPVPAFPTSLGSSDADTITLLGRNLATDMMGKVGYVNPDPASTDRNST